MRLSSGNLCLEGNAPFEKQDLSDMIRRVNRYISTGSYGEALHWIDRYIKMNGKRRDQEELDQLLDMKVQIILIQGDDVIGISPKKALEYCIEASVCFDKINRKETDYQPKIDQVLKNLYQHELQYQKYRELYQLLLKAKESAMPKTNILTQTLKEGLDNAQEIERIWGHKWRRKLHILKDMKERYFHKKKYLDQIGSFYEHGKEEFYYSPDIHGKEHPHREVDLIFYNNDFYVAKDRIVQDVLGTYRMMYRKVYGKSRVKLKKS